MSLNKTLKYFQFNFIQFILYSPISQIASEGFIICTHTTSLSQDLTSDVKLVFIKT